MDTSAGDSEGGGKGGGFARSRRVFRRWGLRASPFVLGAFALCAVFAPWIVPYAPEEDQLRAVHAAPPWYPACEEGRIGPCNVNGIPLGREQKAYYFALGADWLGRDVLSRIIYGARTSLSLAAVAIAIGAVFGAALGLVAGYRGGWVDRIIMRAAGVFSSVLFYIPLIWLALALVQVFGQSFAVAAFALSWGAWMSVARQVREVAACFMTRHLMAAIANAVGYSHLAVPI